MMKNWIAIRLASLRLPPSLRYALCATAQGWKWCRVKARDDAHAATKMRKRSCSKRHAYRAAILNARYQIIIRQTIMGRNYAPSITPTGSYVIIRLWAAD